MVQRKVMCLTYRCLLNQTENVAEIQPFIFFWEQITEGRKAAECFMSASAKRKRNN